MAISRSDMERQLRKDGGIMSMQEPRQGYFLGKLVKKAKRAVKKVVKSPIGKAAILGGLTFGVPGTGFKGFLGAGKGGGGLGSFIKRKLLGTPFAGDITSTGGPGILQKLGLIKGDPGSFGGLTGLGKIASIGAVSGLGGLLAAREQDDEEEFDISKVDRGEGLNIADIVRRARLQDPEFRFLPGAGFTDMYAEGGKVKELTGDDRLALEMFGKLFEELSNKEKDFIYYKQNMAYGGRIGKQEGGGVGSLAMNKENVKQKFVSDEAGAIPKKMKDGEGGVLPSDMGKLKRSDFDSDEDYQRYLRQLNRKAEGGIMDLGGLEMDLRGGGFVPIGAKEKADDVPARLSKNEFVMTADAVRAAGGGSVDKGADKIYKMMKNLEGQV